VDVRSAGVCRSGPLCGYCLGLLQLRHMSSMRSSPGDRHPSRRSRRPSASERYARRGMLLIVLVGIVVAMAMVLVTALANTNS
jgi:hypothetical protein